MLLIDAQRGKLNILRAVHLIKKLLNCRPKVTSLANDGNSDSYELV